jgi:4-oxalocrotonate tautomerase family enzyme
MPLAKIFVPAGSLTDEQRRAIISGVSEVINTVEQRPSENHKYTYVLITELPGEGWGVGGEPYRKA